jgi:hypothetical protein
LPAGLTCNSATGFITGTPTSAGNTPVNIYATNASGTGTATLIMTIDDNGGGAPPSSGSSGCGQGNGLAAMLTLAMGLIARVLLSGGCAARARK